MTDHPEPRPHGIPLAIYPGVAAADPEHLWVRRRFPGRLAHGTSGAGVAGAVPVSSFR